MEVVAAMSQKDPPRYESQLRRKGGSENVEAEAEATDAMIEQMETTMQAQAAKDAEEAFKKAAKAKAKSKAKAKPKTKGKAKKVSPESPIPDENDEAMDLNDGTALDMGGLDDEGAPEAKTVPEPVEKLGRDEGIAPYPSDPYEPPLHVTPNHIYSNCYKRALVNGLAKAAAADAARTQTQIFREHAVVSKAMVGTFRAPKGSKADPKKK